MNNIQFVARQDTRPFCELLMHGEIHAIASRVISAVGSFFQTITHGVVQPIIQRIIAPVFSTIVSIRERPAILALAQPFIDIAFIHLRGEDIKEIVKREVITS